MTTSLTNSALETIGGDLINVRLKNGIIEDVYTKSVINSKYIDGELTTSTKGGIGVKMQDKITKGEVEINVEASIIGYEGRFKEININKDTVGDIGVGARLKLEMMSPVSIYGFSEIKEKNNIIRTEMGKGISIEILAVMVAVVVLAPEIVMALAPESVPYFITGVIGFFQRLAYYFSKAIVNLDVTIQNPL